MLREGDTLETYGTGNFTYGYFGGVMDAATGLLYVGYGQYGVYPDERSCVEGTPPPGASSPETRTRQARIRMCRLTRLVYYLLPWD